MRVGPRCFGQDSSCPALLRYCSLQAPVARTGVSPSSPGISMPFRFPKPVLSAQPYYPECASTHSVWAPAFSLAATRAIDLFFLLLRVLGCFRSFLSPPAGTGMFRFPAFAPALSRWPAACRPGCPIRTRAYLSPLAAPRAFSQLAASFFASGSLGIRRPPFFASSFVISRDLFSAS